MLVSFSVKNYKSFYEEQTLKMTDKTGKLLSGSVIYGGNAAGKSNLIKAMNDAKQIVINPGYKLSSPVFSKTNKKNPDRITKFTFEFDLDDNCSGTYRYELEIFSKYGINDNNYLIKFEKLTDISNVKKHIVVFEKKYDNETDEKQSSASMDKDIENIRDDLEFAIDNKRDLEEQLSNWELMLQKKISETENLDAVSDKTESDSNQSQNIDAIKEKINKLLIRISDANSKINDCSRKLGTFKESKSNYDNQNNSRLYFYTVLGKKDDCIRENKIELAKEVFNWFVSVLTIVSPSDNILQPKDIDQLSELSAIIEGFDVGVSRIYFTELENAEIEKRLDSFSKTLDERTKRQLQTCVESSIVGITASMIVNDISGIYFISYCYGKPSIKKLIATHNNNTVSNFEMANESDGTRRLVELAPILLENDAKKVYVVDELDRCMHSLLTINFIEEYMRMNNESKQLIITTHESKLLSIFDDSDAVWFANRKNNQTELVRLDSIKGIRKDRPLENQYLEGKLGGIPYLF